MGERKMPERIYISNETGPGYMTTIHDAATGELVPGVVEVHITVQNIIEVVVTTHWPLTPADLAENNPPDYAGETHQGVNVERHIYPMKRLQAESW